MDFDAHCSLGGSGQELLGGKNPIFEGGVFTENTKSLEASTGQQDGIKVLLVIEELANTSRHVAADLDRLEIRAEMQQLPNASDAARADARLVGKLLDASGMTTDEDILDGGARQDTGNRESFREIGGNVFEGVNGDIDVSCGEGFFQFLGEDSLIDDGLSLRTEFREAQVRALVADGFHNHPLEFQLRVGCCQGALHHLRLGESEGAAARAYFQNSRSHDWNCCECAD